MIGRSPQNRESPDEIGRIDRYVIEVQLSWRPQKKFHFFNTIQRLGTSTPAATADVFPNQIIASDNQLLRWQLNHPALDIAGSLISLL